MRAEVAVEFPIDRSSHEIGQLSRAFWDLVRALEAEKQFVDNAGMTTQSTYYVTRLKQGPFSLQDLRRARIPGERLGLRRRSQPVQACQRIELARGRPGVRR